MLVITIIVALLFAILIAVAILCKRKEPVPSSVSNGWKARNLHQSTLQVRLGERSVPAQIMIYLRRGMEMRRWRWKQRRESRRQSRREGRK